MTSEGHTGFASRKFSLDARYGFRGVILIAPAVLILATVIVYPLVSAIYLSFFSIFTPTMEGEWIGFDNYSRLLKSGEFWESLKNNVIWTAGTL